MRGEGEGGVISEAVDGGGVVAGGEVELVCFEEFSCVFGSGDDDAGDGAEAEADEGAVEGGEAVEGVVDEGGEEVEVADDGEGERGWWVVVVVMEWWFGFFEVVVEGYDEEGGEKEGGKLDETESHGFRDSYCM